MKIVIRDVVTAITMIVTLAIASAENAETDRIQQELDSVKTEVQLLRMQNPG